MEIWRQKYKMGDAVLGRTTQEKDLGVTFTADMKVSEQCRIAASRGNQVIWLIRRTITYKEKQLIVPPLQSNGYTTFGSMEAAS